MPEEYEKIDWMNKKTEADEINLNHQESGIYSATKTANQALALAENVKSSQITSEAVTATKIGPEAVETSKIKSGAVTEAKLAAGSEGKLIPTGGTESQVLTKGASHAEWKSAGGGGLTSEQVETSNIKAAAVTEPKLGNESVFATKLGAESVETSKIKAAAITEGKLGSESVTAGKIKPEAVESGKIKNNAVTAEKLASESVETTKIKSSAVTESKLGSESVTEGKLGKESVAETKIKTSAVTTEKIASEAVETGKIKTGAVTEPKLTRGSEGKLIAVGGSAGQVLVRKGTTETEWKTSGGSTGVTELKIGLNGLYRFYGEGAAENFEEALGLKRERTNIGQGPGNAFTSAYQTANIEDVEKFLKKGGRAALVIFSPRVSEVEVFTRMTHTQTKEGMENTCKWIKKLNEELGYVGISEIEFYNEPYFAEGLYSAKEYAEQYAVAHKVTSEYGYTLIAFAWGDINQNEKRLETELTAKANSGATTIEVGSVAKASTTGVVVIQEERRNYSKIEGKKLTLTSALSATHEKSIAKSVFITTTELFEESHAESGGGWCYLFCKALGEISEAPRIPDAWSFHPYGNINGRFTGEPKGWLTVFNIMDILRSQGIYAPMNVTEMGNDITGEGGVAGPSGTEEEVAKWLENYLRDGQAKGLASFYGFYAGAPQKPLAQKVFKNAVLSGVNESFEDSFGEEEISIHEGGVQFQPALHRFPRVMFADIYAYEESSTWKYDAKAKYILTMEPSYEPSWVVLKLFKYETATVPKEITSEIKIKIFWYAKR